MSSQPLLPVGDSETESFDSHFRDPAFAAESPLAWNLGQRLDVLDALRGLMAGGQVLVRLRLWVFLELAAQPKGRLLREDVNQLFHALRPESLDTILKRLRDIGLLVWDATAQDYHLAPLAQHVQALLAPLARAATEDDEMAALLSQVAGAQALGLSDAAQIRHLHAQLARLYDEFADAIASGSEARLREAQPRFQRALAMVDRAGETLTALIRSEHDDPRLEREARALGFAQARLLSMASQFTRALQQADRQRVTLGSTGITSSDVRQWLQGQASLHGLLADALLTAIRPVFVSGNDLVDVAEGEFERDRPDPQRAQGLPTSAHAAAGSLEVLQMPTELTDLIALLTAWSSPDTNTNTATNTATDGAGATPRPLADAVLGGRFAQSAYRLQLLPLLGDAQARGLNGLTGDFARLPWRAQLAPEVAPVDDAQVAAMSRGTFHRDSSQAHE